MEYLPTLYPFSLQEAFSLIDSKYEIPEDVNENVLRTLRKDTEMQTFKANISEQHERSNCITILCVGTIAGKDSVFIKDSFIRTPPKGSSLPPVCVDIHLKKIKSTQNDQNALSVLDEDDPDPEGFAEFTFKCFHGALVFWIPEHPSSLREALKWKETVVQFAHLQIPCLLVAFNPTILERMGEGKIIESQVALEHFCRDHTGFDSWFEMKSRGWDGEVFEQALSFLINQIKSNRVNFTRSVQ